MGALASAALAIVLASDGTRDRIYFGTDTRAQALLVGAASAALLVRDWPSMNRGWCMIRTRWGRRAARILPLLGLAGLAALTHYATGSAGEFRRGLLIGVAIAAVIVIAPVAMEQRGIVARVLALRPLVWLGTISYGVYLWHWPIFLALNGERTGWSGCAVVRRAVRRHAVGGRDVVVATRTTHSALATGAGAAAAAGGERPWPARPR